MVTQRTPSKAEDERLKPIVASIFEETKHRIGPDKIRIIMSRRGYVASERRIRRLLKELNLACIDRGKTPHNTEPLKQKYYINRLKQQFTVYEPNRVWVCDTTYLYINYEAHYLTVIMDLFSRKIIGYKVVDCLSASPAIELFKTAFEERGCPTGLMFHSDQGGQFTAYRFRVLLRGKKVKQSFSSPGNPYDNAVIESFFRTLKTEQIYVNPPFLFISDSECLQKSSITLSFTIQFKISSTKSLTNSQLVYAANFWNTSDFLLSAKSQTLFATIG